MVANLIKNPLAKQVALDTRPVGAGVCFHMMNRSPTLFRLPVKFASLKLDHERSKWLPAILSRQQVCLADGLVVFRFKLNHQCLVGIGSKLTGSNKPCLNPTLRRDWPTISFELGFDLISRQSCQVLVGVHVERLPQPPLPDCPNATDHGQVIMRTFACFHHSSLSLPYRSSGRHPLPKSGIKALIEKDRRGNAPHTQEKKALAALPVCHQGQLLSRVGYAPLGGRSFVSPDYGTNMTLGPTQ